MADDVTVGELIRQGLEEAGMSQALLASRSGMSTKHINCVIQGLNRLSIQTAIRIEMQVPTLTAEALLIAQVRQEIADYVKKMDEGEKP